MLKWPTDSMSAVLSTSTLVLGAAQVFLLIGMGFALLRKKLRVTIEIGAERTLILDGGNRALFDILNTVSWFGNGTKKIMASCGLDKKDEAPHDIGGFIHLVRDAQSVPPAGCESCGLDSWCFVASA